jgi:hypothetical protein
MLFSHEPLRRLPSPLPAAQVPAYRQVYPQLAAELRRARRYEHKFVLATIGLYPGSVRPAPAPRSPLIAPAGAAPTSVTATTYFLLGSFLHNTLRETDILTSAPEALSYILFLAESDCEHAAQVFERLQAGFRACAAIDLQVGCAEFPRDGLTIEDMLGVAWNGWSQTPGHAPGPTLAPPAGQTLSQALGQAPTAATTSHVTREASHG